MSARRILACALGALIVSTVSANAENCPRQQDSVTFTLSAEDWISTKTARVIISVNAAVNGGAAATARTDMLKAVESIAKADWKLTGFSRAQDQTGLERWSASFEARLPENALGGIHDTAKKVGKAGMQLSVGAIDFTPTLDETESARSLLRNKIYKSAAEQLAALNAALPGRNYRISDISFMDQGTVQPVMMKEMAMSRRGMNMDTVATAAEPYRGADMAMERSEKIGVSAIVTLAVALPQAVTQGSESRH